MLSLKLRQKHRRVDDMTISATPRPRGSAKFSENKFRIGWSHGNAP